MALSAKVYLCLCVVLSQGWGVRVYLICKEIIIEAKDIERRVWCMPSHELVAIRRVWHEAVLRGVVKSVLNKLGRDPCKEALKFSVVMFRCFM